MTVNTSNTHMEQEKVYAVPSRLLNDKTLPKPFISNFEEYKQKWQESVNDPNKFFGSVSGHKHAYLSSA